jgi:hypothetical protein
MPLILAETKPKAAARAQHAIAVRVYLGKKKKQE